MTSSLDKLNLRPQERRLIVAVAIVVFVVVNIIWVVPQFGKVEYWNRKQTDAQAKLQRYNQEIGKVKSYTTEFAALQNEGVSIGNDDPTLTLQQSVSSMAMANGVQIELNSPVQRTALTNSMFEEAGMRITVTSLESNLVAFLYALGSRGTLIRVRTMSLQPDPAQVRLRGTLEFVQSFLKKPTASKTLAPAAKTAGAKATPATTNSAIAKVTTTNAPASTSWFKKLLSRITGSSSSPKPASATNTAVKTSGKPTFTPNTNKAPATPPPSK